MTGMSQSKQRGRSGAVVSIARAAKRLERAKSREAKKAELTAGTLAVLERNGRSRQSWKYAILRRLVDAAKG